MRPPAARSATIAWLAGLVVSAPILADIAARGTRAAITYLAQDAFYYLGVGRNFIARGAFTFDGQHSTNGFHPLWQWTVALLEAARVALGWSEVANLSVVSVLSALIVAAAIVIIGLAILRAHGSLSPLYPLISVGVLGSIVSLCQNRFGTLWVFANSMETPLLLLGYALTLAVAGRLAKRDEPLELRHGVGMGLALALTALSRLEHTLLVVIVLGVLLVRARRAGHRLAPLWWAAAIPAVALLGYALSNMALFGSPVPVSGAMKSSFPRPMLGNLRQLLTDHQEQVLARAAQLLLPLLLATADLFGRALRVARERSCSVWDATLGSWSAFVIAHCCYNLAFVAPWHQGAWYFASALLHGSVVVYDHGQRVLRPIGARRFAALAVIACVVPVAWFVLHFHRADQNGLFATFVEREREPLLRHYAGQPPKIYSVDDGLITYLTPFPTMSGTGLAIDKAAFIHHRAGGSLLGLAYERGFDRFLSWYYGRALVGLTEDASPEEVSKRLLLVPWFRDEYELHGAEFVFHIDYVSPSGELVVLRFEPRHG